ncbi:MAG: DMT family transporter [Candidatus Thermoplasmatota archaeon]|nr:DMT family transporter [Candidatus Thermoplasmatota archaeon]
MRTQQMFIILLLIFSSLTWAGSFVAVRLVYTDLSPLYLGFLRFVVAAPLMVLATALLKKPLFLPKKELPSLFVLSLTGVTLLYIFQFFGVAYTTAATASVLINTNVLFISFFSLLFLKEQFTKKKTAGILLSFAGVILVVYAQMTNDTILVDSMFLFGCLLVLLSAICWAVYSIVGKRLLARYDPFTVTTNVFIVGVLLYVPLVMPGVFSAVIRITIPSLIAILYLGLFCSVFAYAAWYYALKHQQAAESAVFLTLIPLFTMILSFFIIGERPTLLFFLGAAFIMYGVYLTQKKNKFVQKV